jgi:hypothetical protein
LPLALVSALALVLALVPEPELALVPEPDSQ